MRWAVRIRCGGCGRAVWYVGADEQAVAGKRPKATCRTCSTFLAWDPEAEAAAVAEWRRTGKTQTIRTLVARRG